jgi:type IV secretory pathway TraG/TraD family ATPase VirD4
VLIVGPTQGGKTSSLVVPALLTWRGPVVATSVKHDVLRTTADWRREVGEVQHLEPGREQGLTWNPLEGVADLRHALRVAHSLTTRSPRGDGEFWNTLAVKLLGALFFDAVTRERTIFQVAADVESRAWLAWCLDLEPSAVRDILLSFRDYDGRTLDGVVTTADTMVLPWRFAQPLANVRGTLAGNHTLYLCAPRHEQLAAEPLLRGALRMVLEEQQRRCDAGEALDLLLLLDEAAQVATLDELDQLAATLVGLRVTLVTVVQDFAQLHARFGERAATIVNNHTTRVVLAGLADPSATRYLPELEPPARSAVSGQRAPRPTTPLRRRRPRTAVVIAGHRPAFAVRLRPWWRQRRLRARGRRAQSVDLPR